MLTRCVVRLVTRPHKWWQAELLEMDGHGRPVVRLFGAKARDRHLERYVLIVSEGKTCEDGYDELVRDAKLQAKMGSRFRRTGESGWADLSKMQKGPNGRFLCRNCSKEVPAGRRTFCSQGCVDEWTIRSNPGQARKMVFARDKGVCAECGRNTVDDKNRLREFCRELKWIRPKEAEAEGIRMGYSAQQVSNFMHGSRMSLWDADHIVPVVEGGGASGLDNLRTLCLPCHAIVTKQLRTRMSESEKRARQIELGRLLAVRAPDAEPIVQPAAQAKTDRNRMLLLRSKGAR